MTAPAPVVTPDLVAVAWLLGVSGVPSGKVATSVPRDVETWAQSGFIQVTAVGGGPDIDVPMRRPVISVDCWAVNPNSGKPPWGKAATLAEKVRLGCYGPQAARTVTVLGGLTARVLSVYPLSEPRRITLDDGGYARYQIDLQMHWTA